MMPRDRNWGRNGPSAWKWGDIAWKKSPIVVWQSQMRGGGLPASWCIGLWTGHIILYGYRDVAWAITAAKSLHARGGVRWKEHINRIRHDKILAQMVRDQGNRDGVCFWYGDRWIAAPEKLQNTWNKDGRDGMLTT